HTKLVTPESVRTAPQGVTVCRCDKGHGVSARYQAASPQNSPKTSLNNSTSECEVKPQTRSRVSRPGFSSHLESLSVESARLPLTERSKLPPLKRKASPMKRLTLAVVLCLTLYLALCPITASAGQRRSVVRVRYRD